MSNVPERVAPTAWSFGHFPDHGLRNKPSSIPGPRSHNHGPILDILFVYQLPIPFASLSKTV